MSPAALLGAVPREVRGAAAAVAEVGEAAEVLGIALPPAIFAELFQREAARAGIPAELLEAVAGTLTGYRPDALEDGRGGLMGFPGAGADRVVSIDAILSRDPAALATLEAAVREAAERIAAARERAGLGTAIAEYVAGGVCGVVGRAESERCRRDTAAVVGAFIAALARRIPGDRFALLREMLQ